MGKDTIPPHPFVPFSDLAHRFGAKHIKGPVARRFFLLAMKLWGGVFGIATREAVIPRGLKQGENALDFKCWGFPELFYPEMSASFILSADPETNPARKAAQIIKGLRDFKTKVETQTLKEEFEGSKPLDMSRYQYLFSRLMVSEFRGKAPNHRIEDKAPSDYAILWVQAVPYRLSLTTGNGQALSYWQLVDQITRILEDDRTSSAAAMASRTLVGELTWVNNRITIPIFARVQKENPHSMAILDNAAFAVSIDIDDSPTSENEVLHVVHKKNYSNRDHRRSMYAVVTGNARAGITVNPWCGIGGTFSAKLCSELHKSCIELQKEFPDPQPKPEPVRFEKVELDTSFLSEEEVAKVHDSISAVTQHGFFSGDKIVHKIEGIGVNAFKSRGLGADAAFHCGLHLAYQKSFSKCPIVGNFINLRNVRYGDIWRYCATTSEMKDFVHNPNPDTLFRAIEAHNLEIKRQKQAQDEIYLGTLTMIRALSDGTLGMFGLRSLVLVLSAFCANFLRRFFMQDVWVSHIPQQTGFELAGRYGVNLSFLPKGGIAGHYTLFNNHLYLCLMSSLKGGRSYHEQKRFIGRLEQALKEICSLADKRAVNERAVNRSSQPHATQPHWQRA